MTPKFKLGRDFCTMHLPKFHHPMFTRLEVIMFTNKQTPLKTFNVLRYTNMVWCLLLYLYASSVTVIFTTNRNNKLCDQLCDWVMFWHITWLHIYHQSHPQMKACDTNVTTIISYNTADMPRHFLMPPIFQPPWQNQQCDWLSLRSEAGYRALSRLTTSSSYVLSLILLPIGCHRSL